VSDPVPTTTPLLIMRDVAGADLADVHATRSDPEVPHFIMGFAPEPLALTRERLAGAAAQGRQGPAADDDRLRRARQRLPLRAGVGVDVGVRIGEFVGVSFGLERAMLFDAGTRRTTL
jgi:hypothetical protein